MKSALGVIINCISSPLAEASDEVNQESRWVLESIRTSNGIKVLVALIQAKEPAAHADSIRALAARALFGLYKADEQLRQVLDQLHV